MHCFKITMFSMSPCDLIKFQTSIINLKGAVNTTLVIPRLVSASSLYQHYQTVIFTGANRKARHLSARLSGLSPWTLMANLSIQLHPLSGLTTYLPYKHNHSSHYNITFLNVNVFHTHAKMYKNDKI